MCAKWELIKHNKADDYQNFAGFEFGVSQFSRVSRHRHDYSYGKAERTRRIEIEPNVGIV